MLKKGDEMKIHLIMPMAGAGSRFFRDGYVQPKPLIEINGKPFLYWATKSVSNYIDIEDITFVVLEQHVKEYSIDKVIKSFFPESNITVIKNVLPGPVYTCLEGVKHIEDDLPIVFNDCDHMFKCSELNRVFRSDECPMPMHGALLTFKSNEPQFSYVKYDDSENIIGTIEKQVVSNRAICGAYVFRNSELFKNIADIYVKNCPYNECFMSGIYNVMCEQNMLIKDYLLDFHVEFGTPEEYQMAKNSRYFKVIEKGA